VRAPAAGMKKILVAVDGSKPSLAAAHAALEIALATRASLTAVYSVVPTMIPGEVPFQIVSEVLKAEVARGKQVLAEVRDELGNPQMSLVEVEGAPAERIAQLAEEEGFDLVVVGSRGRNAAARVFLGSVANRLVHISKKPVLVVR
jgi:nucleotide-binding universal stress UspA family protein